LAPDDTNISIGRPISNTQVYVLDTYQELVPVGISGELYIGGDGLAQGYLGRPDLTAERFVQNPFSEDSNSKLYRTGDLCRWRNDGTLEYLGRIDHQVKLRGFRIELGEIESVLASHAEIGQCVVILREDRPGDKKLVAYFTCGQGQAPSPEQLRSHVGAALPEYMIPAAYVHLEALPLTPSGKVDRRGLPAPDLKDVHTQERYTAPRNDIESQLAQVWGEVLGLERIGVHDNFFSLGGHSLMAVNLFARINERFGKRLPLSLLFQHGTIAQVAKAIGDTDTVGPIARMVQMSENNAGPKMIFLPGVNGELLYAHQLISRLDSRFNIVGLQPNLDVKYLEQYSDFVRMASEYVKIIVEHQPVGPYRLIGYSYGGILCFEIARQMQQLDLDVPFVGVIDTGPDPGYSLRNPGTVVAHLMRFAINLPRWITANCGVENRKATIDMAYRRIRYYQRLFQTLGKAKFQYDDEFGSSTRRDGRRLVLGQLYQSVREYSPESYSGRVTLFRATTRPLFRALSPDLGWSQVAKNVEIHKVPGDHNSMLGSPAIDQISKVLIDDLLGVRR
jgi:thioesterase domain-containing protein/acyl carrier protein